MITMIHRVKQVILGGKEERSFIVVCERNKYICVVLLKSYNDVYPKFKNTL